MKETLTALREQRREKFFDDCQNQVISQIIGPFGLSPAMFEDKEGGNVTTAFNFEQGCVATAEDKKRYDFYKEKYDRDNYKVSDKEWKQKKADTSNIDGYTGKDLSDSPTDLDHVVSIKEVSTNHKAHLALGQEGIRELVNSAPNLTKTEQGLNRSKNSKNLKDWEKDKRPNSDQTNAEYYEVDTELSEKTQQRATDFIDNTVQDSLHEKYKKELWSTGMQQAIQMGMRQALGVLLTELVKGLFNETKHLVKEGFSLDKSIFQEISERLKKVLRSVASRIPDAISQLFQGGISGFMSNLLTFLINNLVKTAKRVTTIIREGLLGLVKAFKTILFPPKGMTKEQALREGLKILTAVIVTSVGILIESAVSGFLTAIPFLAPFAGLVSPVLVGILTGILTAFLAYNIDCIFDKMAHNSKELFMDELIVNSGLQQQFSGELASLTESRLVLLNQYGQAISIYQNIGENLGSAQRTSAATLSSLQRTNEMTRTQIRKSHQTIDFINESQAEIEEFLVTI